MAKALPSTPSADQGRRQCRPRARGRRICAIRRQATRAVREYLRHSMSRVTRSPFRVDLADRSCCAVDGGGGPAFYAYSTNYLVDVQAGIVVDVEATPTLRTAEVKATRTMIERVEERFALKPERLIGDMAYGQSEPPGWMVNDKGIEPHVPLWDRTLRDDGTLSSSDFEWVNRPTNTAAHRASRGGASGGFSNARERASPKQTPSSITPAKPHAASVR